MFYPWNFLRDAGVALLAIGLTAPLSTYYLQKQTSEYMGILKGAAEGGIVNIFEKRANPEAEKEIKEILEEAEGEIKIAGIGLADFIINDPDRRPFRKSFIKKLSDGTLVKILVLKPDGDSAKYRKNIESPYGHNTIREIKSSITELHTLREQFGEKIDAHLFDFNKLLHVY